MVLIVRLWLLVLFGLCCLVAYLVKRDCCWWFSKWKCLRMFCFPLCTPIYMAGYGLIGVQHPTSSMLEPVSKEP
ncbi:hypothetical protein BDV19DRAFT_237895 [Aspergillus venezuelensis]